MIGLIFGETDFPKYIYKKIKDKKKYIIIDLTKKKLFKKDKDSFSVSIGQLGKIISILKQHNCKKVLLAGKVQKPNFSKLRLDFKGVYYIPRIIKKAKLGDVALLKEIIDIFKKERIQTISSTIFTPELNLSKGNYSKLKPNLKDKIDIKNALKALNKSSQYSHIQGAVSRNNIVILEKREGTQKMLKKIKKIKNITNGVLVKFPKKKQDYRVDLPTIGLKTFKQCKMSGIKGIVLKHKRNIFLDKKKTIKYANKNKMFILVK
ncbi:UDP-2,3-diacylglucosamine diphosphatase LpxI [Pelagibacterales bacterium SAG-MED28]|nr:UDP-2,3-diacylglucosamine diphosphatase LpxI [Pelagibacterales bacterium SAG-MED28]MBD1149397.1 UDP-2,3-diacylglucosamine diphosphatase LpxI [Pelagibacterales bacterium SAG-MED27]